MNPTSYINVGAGAPSMSLHRVDGPLLPPKKESRGCPIRYRIRAAPAKASVVSQKCLGHSSIDPSGPASVQIERMTDAEHERVVVGIRTATDEILGAVDPRRQ